jgi:hypothetical protein
MRLRPLETLVRQRDDNAEIVLPLQPKSYCWRIYFGQPRDKVIDRAVIKSLELLKKEILKMSHNFVGL